MTNAGTILQISCISCIMSYILPHFMEKKHNTHQQKQHANQTSLSTIHMVTDEFVQVSYGAISG